MVYAGGLLVALLIGYWLGGRGKAAVADELNKLRADVASGVWGGKKPKAGTNGE